MQVRPEVLIAEEAIEKRVGELAASIDRDYAGAQELVLVGVLKGAFVFLADLARRLTVAHRIEFIAVSSYGMSGAESGAVRLIMDVRVPVEDRPVLIVEDIVDTGRTLEYLIELLSARRPASIGTCALVRKRSRQEADVRLDHVGFDIPDVWVVGYGLDYAERHRTLPYIGVIHPED